MSLSMFFNRYSTKNRLFSDIKSFSCPLRTAMLEVKYDADRCKPDGKEVSLSKDWTI